MPLSESPCHCARWHNSTRQTYSHAPERAVTPHRGCLPVDLVSYISDMRLSISVTELTAYVWGTFAYVLVW